MTAPRFIAVHRTADTSLACAAVPLTPDEVTACTDAAELLQALQRLHDTRRAALDTATDEARAAGYAAGRLEALQVAGPRLLQAWEDAAARMAAQMEEVEHAWRRSVIDWGCAIVQHIAESLAPAEVVAALAARALQALPAERHAVVRVHPEVAAVVRDRLAANAAIGTLDVQGDPALDWSDCHIDTPAGRWLAGLHAQLARIAHDTQRPTSCP